VLQNREEMLTGSCSINVFSLFKTTLTTHFAAKEQMVKLGKPDPYHILYRCMGKLRSGTAYKGRFSESIDRNTGI
jgi:hypothetical protein